MSKQTPVGGLHSFRVRLLLTGGLLSIILCLSFLSGQAQVLYGALTGNVTDASGAAVSGAKVEALNVATGVVRDTVTDATGGYRITAVQPGIYKVTVSAPKFASAVAENVEVIVNNVRRVDAQLKVASQQQDVTVTAEAPVLQTDKADVHLDITSTQISSLPISSSQGRNFQSLYKFIPGSGLPTEANSPAGNPNRSISVSTNGQSIQTNSIRIDGSANQYPWLPQNTAYIPPADAIETVNITTNSFDAEQGAAGGAAVNVQIKSGTNQLHGTAHEFHNDSALNAKNFFFPQTRVDPLTGQTVTNNKPKNVFNQFGGTIGGPIKKDKLFFFGDYERTTQRAVGSSTQTVFGSSNSSLPDYYQKVRAGDFSGAGMPIIYDPLTGNADGSGRQQISCNGVLNVICPNRIDPAAKAFMARIPVPNVPVTTLGKTSNYFATLPTTYTRDNFDVKINYVPSTKSTVFARYSFSQTGIIDPPVFSDPTNFSDPNLGAGGGAIGGGSSGTAGGRVQSVGLGATYTFTPSVLVDWNFGFTRQRLNAFNFDLPVETGTLLGIPGSNGQGVVGDTSLYGGIPAFAFTGGYSTLGNPDTGNPFLFRDNQWVTNGNLSWNFGKHALRFGVEMNRAGVNHFQPQGGSFGTARGTFNFSGAMTQLPTGNNPTNSPTASLQNALADFLLGLPSRQAKSVQTVNPIALRWTTWAAYARDQFQITPKLTLSYGVRWEYYPFATSDNGRGVPWFDSDPTSPNYGSILVGGINGIPTNDTVDTHSGQFLPRIGVAYRLDDKTVIRAGYGMSADPNNWRFFRNNYPNLPAIDLSGAPATSYGGTSTSANFVPADCLTQATCTAYAGLYPGLPVGLTQVQVPPLATTAVFSLDPTKGGVGNIGGNTSPRDFRRGYINSFNLTVQREIAGFVLDTGYVGARGIRPLALIQLNTGTIGGGTNSAPFNQLLHQTTADTCPTLANPAAKCTNALGIGSYTPWKNNYYDSWQTKLTRRLGGSSQLGIIYTWQHAISYSDSEELQSVLFTLPQYYEKNRATSTLDRTHNFQFYGIYELPFGKGKRWATAGIGNALAGGWQVNGVFSKVSGSPFTILSSSNNLNAPGSGQQAADQVGPVHILGNTPRLGCTFGDLSCSYFDPSAFANAPGTREGTVNRNSIRGPGFTNLDLSLFRNFRITERFTFQFRTEAFSVTNTPHFLNPGGNTNGTFSASTATINTTNFGAITSTLGGRQGTNLSGSRTIFFAGKLIF